MEAFSKIRGLERLIVECCGDEYPKWTGSGHEHWCECGEHEISGDVERVQELINHAQSKVGAPKAQLVKESSDQESTSTSEDSELSSLGDESPFELP